MENNWKEMDISDLINKQIINLNWESKLPNYETKHYNYDFKSVIGKDVGIIIDNGSYECRAGWSFSDVPNMRFRSIIGKPKVQAKHQSNDFLVGNEMLTIEQGKLHKKSPFDKNLVTHFGAQEHILDHIFTNLNLNSSSVEHPVLITEPLCNINWSRKNLTEIFFELYSVPSLCYGVDMFFSLDYNLKFPQEKEGTNSYKIRNKENCLIISSSYQTTHIVPILNGKINIDKTRRISVGAFHSNELLTKSLHLKYPDLRNKFTTEIIEEIQENYTMCAKDYKKQLELFQHIFECDQERFKDEEKKRMFGSLEMYEKAYKDEIYQKKIQDKKYKHLKAYKNITDYNNQLYDYESNLNYDSIVKDLIFFELPKLGTEVVLTEEELRRKQELRKEQSKRLRELMQRKKEENIKQLQKELVELEQVAALKENDKYQFEEALLSKGFANNEELEKRINKIFMKINFNKENKEEEEKFDEEKRWALINIPDEDLTDEQQKSKRIQKMQRQAYITRLERRELQKREKERVEELKQMDPENYLISLYKKKKELLDKIERYKQMRKELSNRHSKANLRRMMVLAELGKEGGTVSKKGEIPKDDFGINDEDWEIYRGISRHNLSEDEEEDQQQLNEIEAQIIEVDPNYFKYSDNITQGFMFGSQHLCLGVDQFRGPELLFQPYIIGSDQAGLTEIILSILKTMSFEEQKLLAGNIFLTGGNSKTKYLADRIYKDLRANLHCDIDININLASDAELDSWKGARLFMNDKNNERYFITRQEYLEYGADYFKEHRSSNNVVNFRGGSNFSYEESKKKQKIN